MLAGLRCSLMSGSGRLQRSCKLGRQTGRAIHACISRSSSAFSRAEFWRTWKAAVKTSVASARAPPISFLERRRDLPGFLACT